MSNNTMNFAKGMGIGVAVGAAAAVAAKMMMKSNHTSMTKGSAKAVKAVGDFVDGVQTMFK